MAGHVDDVSGPRHERGQSIGVGLRTLRAVGGFHKVSIGCIAHGCVRNFREHTFQALYDIGRPALWVLAARLPIVPGLGVHRRLGSQYRQFEVVWILVRQGRRCVCEGGVKRRPFCNRILRISSGYCLDESLLLSLAPAERACAFRSAAIAGALDSGSIGTLMFGPRTSASPGSTWRTPDPDFAPCGKRVSLPHG